MPGEYSINLDPTVQPVQHGRNIVSIEVIEEIKAQLKEMIMQDIITLQVEPTPCLV